MKFFRTSLCLPRTVMMAVFLASLPFLSACGQNPKIDVTAKTENGKIIFDIPRKDINGLLGFRVGDGGGKYYWDVDLHYDQSRAITYGELPTAGNSDAAQVIPSDGSLPPEIWGKTITIFVDYQYDEFGAASVSTYEKTLQMPAEPEK